MTRTGFFSELRRRHVLPVAGAYIVIAWLVTEIAGFLLEQAGAPSWMLRLLAIVFIVGFPVTAVLAWVIQKQPDGRRAIDPSQGQRKAVLVAVSVGVLATAGLAWLILPRIEDTPSLPDYDPLPNSVAIVPFIGADATPNERTVGETLYHALRQGLNRSRELTQVRLKTDTVPDDLLGFGRRVRVSALLTGRIRAIPGGSRIEMELLDVARNAVRWTHSFDWDPTRIMETGTDIANGVLQSMALPVLSMDRFAGTDDREAYDALLMGYRYHSAFIVTELPLAMEEFERAFEIDPGYVNAYYALAQTIMVYLAYKGPEEEERTALRQRQRELLDTALDLDPDFAPAISLLGLLAENEELRYQAFERALELDPDHALTYHRYANFKQGDGDFEEAERLFRKALEYQPLNAKFRADLGSNLWMQGRAHEAVAEVEYSIELEPRFEQNYRMLAAWNHFVLGSLDEAIYWMRRAYEVNPETGMLAGFVAGGYAQLEMREEALAWIDRTLEMGPTHFWAWQMAGAVHLWLGDDDVAEAYFDKADALNPGVNESIWGRNSELNKQIEEDLEAGQGERALQRYEEAFPEIAGRPVEEFEYEKLFQWQKYGGLLIEAGEVERGRRLLEGLASHLEDKCREGWFIMKTGGDLCENLIFIYADLEDRVRTLAALQRFIVDEHRRAEWSEYRQPAFNFVRDDPEFQELMDYLQADLAAQRERVREMERNGEMPQAPGVLIEPQPP